MPFSNYKLPQGSLTARQKLTAQQKEMIVHKTTDIVASIYGDAARHHTMVLVEESPTLAGALLMMC